MRTYSILCLMLTGLIFACQDNAKSPYVRSAKDTLPAKSNIDPSIPGNFSPQRSLHFDSTQIDQFLVKYPQLKDFGGDIRQFYTNRQYAYAKTEADYSSIS